MPQDIWPNSTPRITSRVFYQGGKLFVYGGWANRWFSDGFTLDVGCIVGPPYAVMDLIPDNGPITGETLLEIHGIDFINTEDVTVSILSGQGRDQTLW